MKPVQLRLQAFGPFATSQTVDFFRVFNGGLFLIHGRTGAGKTSLLDGLCFSLFGRPSTAEREKDLRALRSHLADNSLPTETELIFTVGEEAFRVHRIPSQQVPKKRGDGFTELKGSAELWRFHSALPTSAQAFTQEISKTENWIPVASKLESVDREIETLLGMNERQFRQVVILPQGKFREFLSSTSSERQTILERLFQTDRFSRLQSFVATHVRDLETQWKQQVQEIEAKLKSTGLASTEEIPTRLQSIMNEVGLASAKAENLRAQTTALRDHLKLKEDFESTSRRLVEIDGQLSSLEETRGAIDDDRSKFELYDLLGNYRSFNENYGRATRQLAELINRRDVAAKESNSLAATIQRLKLGLEDEAARVPRLADFKIEYQKLRELFPVLSALSKEQMSLNQERLALTDLNKDMASRKTMADKMAPAILDSLVTLEKTDVLLSSTERQEAETSNHLVAQMELAYHQAEAARIALQLKEKDPCPVCGSLEHPRPAMAGTSPKVDLGTLKKAQENHSKLRERHSTLIAQRKASLLSIYNLIESLGLKASRNSGINISKPVTDFAALAGQTERHALLLIKTRQELSSLVASHDVKFEAIAKRERELQSKLEEIAPADRDLELVIARGSEAKKQIEAREAFIAQTTNELTTFDSKLANLTGILSAKDTEIAALKLEIQGIESMRETELLSVGKTHPTVDIPNWNFTKSDRDRCQTAVREFETKQIQAKAAREEGLRRLSELTLLLPEDTRSTTVAALRTELQEVGLALQSSETLLARLRVEDENLQRISGSIDSDRKKLNKIRNESERSIRINGLLSGDRAHNRLAVPLARFVLQSRFEDVLDQANLRLGRMSRGRYLLRRPALTQNLAQSQGLSLSVEDSMTGKERHADSLSGGESFMAALSLALGLADVVQADLGGVKLDSVIIDEGFGTLDSESLDLALRTLVDLQAGGRMVGVISHVQELKSQIDQRLEVIPSPDGSRLQWEADRAAHH
ncbi:MAG: SMC family ATPase [Deltaproteobacteria bacterium]|nr:SMC family ATPase [Deltaproteobacteria bacterium]